MLIVGVMSFVAALAVTPLVRDAALILGLVDRPNSRKMHAKAVPRIGGMAIGLAILLSLWLARSFSTDPVTASAMAHLERVFPAVCIIFLAGLWDDFFGLKPWLKMFWLVVGSLVVIFYADVQIQMIGWHQLSSFITIPLTIVWLIACSNAFNLIDGVDGLATGIGLFATITTLLAALTHGNLDLALLTIPLVGALLGFLRYNFNPASIFLGDSGSLLIGFLLGCYGVLWSQKSATLLGMTAPLMALGIPLMDTILAIVRRFLRHQPIFGADRGHIHHRLLDRGLTPRRVALVLYGVCGFGAACSLLANMDVGRFGGLVVILFCLGAWIGVQHLGYAEFGATGRMLSRFRRLVDQDVKLRFFETQLAQTTDVEAFWDALMHSCGSFGFEGIRLVVGDRVYECGETSATKQRLWHVQVTQPSGDYIALFRRFDTNSHPTVDTGYVTIVESALQRSLPLFARSSLAPAASRRLDEIGLSAKAS